MALGYGNFPFGLREVQLSSMDGAVKVKLNAAQTLGYKERVVSSELRGNDKLKASSTIPDGYDWSLEEGGIPLDALALVTGRTVVESGTTPNRISTMDLDAEVAYPYFKIEGRVVNEDGLSDLVVALNKCKVTGSVEGDFGDGEFLVTKMSGVAVDDGTGSYGEMRVRETGAALA